MNLRVLVEGCRVKTLGVTPWSFLVRQKVPTRFLTLEDLNRCLP